MNGSRGFQSHGFGRNNRVISRRVSGGPFFQSSLRDDGCVGDRQPWVKTHGYHRNVATRRIARRPLPLSRALSFLSSFVRRSAAMCLLAWSQSATVAAQVPPALRLFSAGGLRAFCLLEDRNDRAGLALSRRLCVGGGCWHVACIKREPSVTHGGPRDAEPAASPSRRSTSSMNIIEAVACIASR